MGRIGLSDAQAWADRTKLFMTELDPGLEVAQAEEVVARLSSVYDTSTWVDETSTPPLVKKIIAMMYVGWYYQRTYSEDEPQSSYGNLLISQALTLLEGLESSVIVLDDVPLSPTQTVHGADFYPTDLSSANSPTFDDPSLGGPAFTMGKIW